jgi:hypothetical protein
MSLLEVSSHVLVSAEPERVWQAAMDWSRQQEWMWGTRVRGGTGVGSRVVARTGLGPLGFADTMVITEWDPPNRCVVRHTGKIIRGLGIFEVARRGELCEFRWTEQLQLPLSSAGLLSRGVVVPLGRWIAVPLAQLALDGSLRRFARLL